MACCSISHAVRHILPLARSFPLSNSFLLQGESLPTRAAPSFGLRHSLRIGTSSHSPRVQRKPCFAARLESSDASSGVEIINDGETQQVSKLRLLQAIRGAERGARTNADQRAVIEEAQIELERFGGEVVGKQLNHLNGLWKLVYTTAPDVISLLQAPQLLPIPIFQVGDIFQRFECSEGNSDGVVENIVKWSVAGILQDNDGAQLTVKAKFNVKSNRSIQLRFEEARVGNVQISSTLETILAPAILPRTQINMEILQFLRGIELSLPLSGQSSLRQSTVGLSPYMLTFLDSDLLVGRAISPPGTFIFQRA